MVDQEFGWGKRLACVRANLDRADATEELAELLTDVWSRKAPRRLGREHGNSDSRTVSQDQRHPKRPSSSSPSSWPRVEAARVAVFDEVVLIGAFGRLMRLTPTARSGSTTTAAAAAGERGPHYRSYRLEQVAVLCVRDVRHLDGPAPTRSPIRVEKVSQQPTPTAGRLRGRQATGSHAVSQEELCCGHAGRRCPCPHEQILSALAIVRFPPGGVRRHD